MPMSDPSILAEQPGSLLFGQEGKGPSSEFGRGALPLPNVALDNLLNNARQFLDEAPADTGTAGGGARLANQQASLTPGPQGAPGPTVQGAAAPGPNSFDQALGALGQLGTVSTKALDYMRNRDRSNAQAAGAQVPQIPPDLGLNGAPFSDPRFPGMSFPTRTNPTAEATGGPMSNLYTVIETPQGPEIVLNAEASAAQGEQGTSFGNGDPSGGVNLNSLGGPSLGAAGGLTSILLAALGEGPASQRAIQGASGAAQVAGSAAKMSDLLGLSQNLGGSVGAAAPYIGTVLSILNTAMSQKPDSQKALESAIDAAALGLAGPTGGISLVAAPVIKAHAGSEMKYLNQGDTLPAILNADPILGFTNAIPNLFGFDLFGELFGSSPKVDVQVPGYTHPIKQTLGGAKTSNASYNEGLAGLGDFGNALAGATTPDALVQALGQQYSAFPGQFKVHAATTKGEGLSNLGAESPNYQRTFAASDFTDPRVLDTLGVYAGAMGAPAFQGQATDALKAHIQALNDLQAQNKAAAANNLEVARQAQQANVPVAARGNFLPGSQGVRIGPESDLDALLNQARMLTANVA